MTIASPTARQSFQCNGTTTVFGIDIQAYLETDFVVLLTNVSTGVSTMLALGGDYTLASTGSDSPQQWNLTTQTGQFTSPFASGYTLQVILDPTQTQQTQYSYGVAFPSSAVQQNMDRLTQMVLRLQDQVNRALRAQDGDVAPSMLLPPSPARALQYLGFDTNGNAIVVAALPGSNVTQQSIGAALYPITPGESAAGVVPANLGYAPGNVLRYAGADPTGASDSTAAFIAAHASNASVYAPAGTYLFNQTQFASAFVIWKSNFTLFGDGSACTQIIRTENSVLSLATGLGAVNVFPIFGNQSTVRIYGIRITGPFPPALVGQQAANARNYASMLQIHGYPVPYTITDLVCDDVICEYGMMAGFAIGGYEPNGAFSNPYYSAGAKFVNCLARYNGEDGFNCFACANGLQFFGVVAHDNNGFGHEHGTGSLLIQGGKTYKCGQGGIGTDYNSFLGANQRTVIMDHEIHDIGNAFYTQQPGISLGQAFSPFNTQIIGCSIARTGGPSIIVNGGAPGNVTIMGNALEDCGSGVACPAIQMDAGMDMVVLGNSIKTLTAGYNMTYGVGCIGTPGTGTIVDGNRVIGASLGNYNFGQPAALCRNIPSFIQQTAFPNSGTNQGSSTTTVASYTVVGNLLEALNMTMRVRISGVTASNADAKSVAIEWNGNVLLNTGSLSANGKPWVLEVLLTVQFAGASGILGYSGQGQFNGAIVQAVSSSLGGVDFLTANTLTVVATGTTTGDTTIQALEIDYPNTY
jgi:hypothetical protein